jgi:hypothetical protein
MEGHVRLFRRLMLCWSTYHRCPSMPEALHYVARRLPQKSNLEALPWLRSSLRYHLLPYTHCLFLDLRRGTLRSRWIAVGCDFLDTARRPLHDMLSLVCGPSHVVLNSSTCAYRVYPPLSEPLQMVAKLIVSAFLFLLIQ